jgi:hypothetical protein
LALGRSAVRARALQGVRVRGGFSRERPLAVTRKEAFPLAIMILKYS